MGGIFPELSLLEARSTCRVYLSLFGRYVGFIDAAAGCLAIWPGLSSIFRSPETIVPQHRTPVAASLWLGLISSPWSC